MDNLTITLEGPDNAMAFGYFLQNLLEKNGIKVNFLNKVFKEEHNLVSSYRQEEMIKAIEENVKELDIQVREESGTQPHSKVPLYCSLTVNCGHITHVQPFLYHTGAKYPLRMSMRVEHLDLGDIIEKMIRQYGETEVIQWITEKPYNPVEHTPTSSIRPKSSLALELLGIALKEGALDKYHRVYKEIYDLVG